jgi:hypothetical protein
MIASAGYTERMKYLILHTLQLVEIWAGNISSILG